MFLTLLLYYALFHTYGIWDLVIIAANTVSCSLITFFFIFASMALSSFYFQSQALTACNHLYILQISLKSVTFDVSF